MTQVKEGAFTIKIFVPGGTPDGLRLLEKSNWTGLGLVCPRSVFPEAKGEDEFGRTGVYILEGRSEQSELPTIYVGQGDCLRDRLSQHYGQKDFWDRVVLFVSKDDSLNRAHVQYMEAQLVERALEVKRSNVENRAVPQRPNLSAPDEADVTSFLADVLSILPLVGLTAFERPHKKVRKRELFVIDSKGIRAQGGEVPEGFLVLAGSQAVAKEVPSVPVTVSNLRRDLQEQGVLVMEAARLRFMQDYSFNSPSLAACVCLGRSANGRVEWMNTEDQTLKEVQEAAVPAE